MIIIVDYGMGNIRSVQKAIESLGKEVKISCEKEEILNSEGIILPGVGAFKEAMRNLKEKQLDIAIKEGVKKGIPLLGICLGMQLLFENGEEGGSIEGLGLLKGTIKKIHSPYEPIKIPHMGWNNLRIQAEDKLLTGVPQGSFVYFVHSYYAAITEEGILKADSYHGILIPAVVGRDNVYGVQFHPEKSSEIGIQILRNFVEGLK